jgi:pimeloyl-ACP methyl ester carboxylesterase
VKSPAAAALLVVLLAGCPKFHSGRLRNSPAEATFIEVDGVHLRYLDVGKGPVVVLLHGYGSAIESWHAIIPALKAKHRVIAVDLKGFGWSSRPPGDYSPPAHATLLWHLLDKRGIKHADLVGHSWGASVALAMALAKPDRVRRIALFSAYVYEAQVPSFMHWARTSLGEMLFALYYRESVEERLPLAFADDRFVTAMLVDRADKALDRPGTVAAALATARGQRYSAVEKRYHTIVKPVLLLWGREDIVTPLNFGERLSEDLPNARLEVLPRCGHIPMIEAANASARTLVAFLGEGAGGSDSDSDSDSDTDSDTDSDSDSDTDIGEEVR